MARKGWCSNCTKYQTVDNSDSGLLCCTSCGKIVDEDLFSSEPTFVKNAAGQSQLAGNYVKTVQGDISVSRERTLDNAKYAINTIAANLGIGGGDQIANPAVSFYRMALERNFTRGRRADLVAAACLYIACRESNKPFLLIEFAEFLRVNVYVLGAVFLQLCKVLCLDEHPIVQKPVDPSLFIHRFTNVLLGEMNHSVQKTALHILASMKRNWMQTGRKPSGLCGAALYISALSHGLKFSKNDIIKIVHICEATLTKRLIEFEDTESGSLTIEELNQKAEELEKSYKSTKLTSASATKGELLCEHKGSEASHFAHGLCERCYDEFVKISGGLDGDSEPPAFQRAERDRMAKACEDNVTESIMGENEIRNLETGGIERSKTLEPGAVLNEHEGSDNAHNKSHEADTSTKSGDESESLSDIDDAEVDGYLHNEEEKHYKKIIWEEMNREYLVEQANKEAAAAAARESNKVNFENCSADVLAAKEFAATVAAKVTKSKKERQQKRAAEAVNPQTAAEATHQMLTKKRFSTKINYDVLKEIFDEPVVAPKKNKIETHSHPESVISQANEDDGIGYGPMDDNYNNDGDQYQSYSYYDNEDEGYNDYDDGLC